MMMLEAPSYSNGVVKLMKVQAPVVKVTLPLNTLSEFDIDTQSVLLEKVLLVVAFT